MLDSAPAAGLELDEVDARSGRVAGGGAAVPRGLVPAGPKAPASEATVRPAASRMRSRTAADGASTPKAMRIGAAPGFGCAARQAGR
jgi:hypothetical protein